jgi:hypothetical protein
LDGDVYIIDFMGELGKNTVEQSKRVNPSFEFCPKLYWASPYSNAIIDVGFVLY